MVAANITPAVFFDPEQFAKTWLRILDRDKRLIPLTFNSVQRDFLRKRTRRDIVLKARQLGFSTFLQADLFRVEITSTVTTLTLTHLDTTTQALRRMADRFYTNMPMSLRPARKYANATVTTYPDFDSEAIIATAGSENSARGITANHAHLSEVAFWNNAQDVMASAMQSIPTGGTVTIESTPNGAQGWFYERCMEAIDGNGDWRLHFYPWWKDLAYRLNVPELQDISDNEQRLMELHGLDYQQIAWRRSKQNELKHLFAQEYPEDPITCFLLSGIGYFGDVSQYFDAPQAASYDDSHEYMAGLDFGQTQDYTVCSVIDRNTKQQVDLLRVNQMSWADMRRRVVDVCKHWHIKRLTAETNSMGTTNIEALQSELSGSGTSLMPFNTTNQSKAMIMQDLHTGLHETGLRLLNTPEQRHEVLAFTSKQTVTGAWQLAAPNGQHDDTVIALALAWHGCLHIPARAFIADEPIQW